MTAFNVNQLPTGNRAIATLEELVVWAVLAISETNTKTFIPRQNAESERVSSVQIGLDYNKTNRAQAFLSLQVLNGWNGSQGTPLWKNVAPIEDASIPAAFSN